MFIALTALLSLYVGLVALGVLDEDPTFVGVVAVSVVIITCILKMRDLFNDALASERGPRWMASLALSVTALLMALVGGGYQATHMSDLLSASPFFEPLQLTMGAVFLAAVVLASMLHWGLILPGIVTIAIAYFFYGHRLDSPLFSHPPYDLGFVLNYLALDPSQGVFLFLRTLTADLWFLIIFGAILVGIGVVRLFMELGNAIGTKVAGGAAFPAIIASGAVGSILAQAVASTTIIGRLTIPAMMRSGYSPSISGAIETLAATSGQLMPPILGLAAFIMAALLNTPYASIALAALIPALLYLAALVFAVMSYSARLRIGTISVKVDWHAIWRLLPAFVVPFGAVMWLLMRYVSPAIAGSLGIVLAICIWALSGRYRVSAREVWTGVVTGFELVILLAILILLIGPLAQTFQSTGISNNFGLYLALLVPDSKFVILLVSAVVVMVLGMGLPTPIAYLASVLTMGSFLIQVGKVDALLAHFFLFYFAVFSTITPPIAVGALAASKIANVSYWYIGGQSLKIAVPMFILPFVFVYNPALLEFPRVSWALAFVVALVLLVQALLASAQFGYLFRHLSGFERTFLFLVAAAGFVALLADGVTSKVVFAAVALLIGVYLYWTGRTGP